MKEQGNHNDFLSFQCARALLNLNKEFLIILEDFKTDGFLTQDGYNKLRSRLLRAANDKIRDLQEVISQCNIELKKQ